KEVPPPPKPVEKVIKKAEIAEDDKPKVKVVGKIELGTKTSEQKTKPEPEQKEAREVTPPVSEEPVQDTQSPEKEDELVKAEAPQLQGLKILGKIDTNKFDTP